MTTPVNINNPSGFTAVKKSRRHARAGEFRSRLRDRSGLAKNIYRGSLVDPTGTGNNIAVVAAGNNPSIGGFHRVNYVAASGETQFRPKWISGTVTHSGSAAEATVFNDADLLFDARCRARRGSSRPTSAIPPTWWSARAAT